MSPTHSNFGSRFGTMPGVRIRNARPEDRAALAKLRPLCGRTLVEEHEHELVPILAGKPPGIMPLVYFVAEDANGVSSDSSRLGCGRRRTDVTGRARSATSKGGTSPESHRRRGVGAQLIAAAENWAREQGCTEMASDTQLDNTQSLQAHLRLGYEIAERVHLVSQESTMRIDAEFDICFVALDPRCRS